MNTPVYSFSGDMARLQQATAESHDNTVRRSKVLAVLNLRTGEQVLEVGCGGGFCHNGIGKAMKEKQLAAVRLEFFEIGCVCVEPCGQCVIERVHVTVEIESQLVEVIAENPVHKRGRRNCRRIPIVAF